MKRTILTLLAATSLAVAIPAIASAQPAWMSINQRQANLDARIDAGVRSGELTRNEAGTLRAEFNGIASLENQYRASAPGLTNAERTDLDRRFDALSGRIQVSRNDMDDRGNQGGWQNINQRQASLDARIDAGVRSGQLTRNEAVNLRAEFNGIAVLENRYRASAPGLTNAERADLDRRFDTLSGRIQVSRNDNDGRGNQNAWQNINQRQERLDRRIDRAQRDGRLSRREARSIRAEFTVIARLEATYRASRPGLTNAERADLDRRFDRLSDRVRDESRDREYGYGYGRTR